MSKALSEIPSGLNNKDQAICLSWVESYNVTKVAEKFGTNTHKIYCILRKAEAQEYIQILMEEEYTGAIITADFIKTHYLSLLPKVLGEEDVNLINASGDAFSGKKFDAPATLGVLRDMSKTVEGFDKSKERAEAGGVTVNINMGALLGNPPIDIEVIEHD